MFSNFRKVFLVILSKTHCFLDASFLRDKVFVPRQTIFKTSSRHTVFFPRLMSWNLSLRVTLFSSCEALFSWNPLCDNVFLKSFSPAKRCFLPESVFLKSLLRHTVFYPRSATNCFLEVSQPLESHFLRPTTNCFLEIILSESHCFLPATHCFREINHSLQVGAPTVVKRSKSSNENQEG